MTTYFLTHDEIQELTGKSVGYAQRTALNTMGIEYKQRPDGSPAVLRAHVEEQMGLKRSPTMKAYTPNFNALA